jgi:protein ImuA
MLTPPTHATPDVQQAMQAVLRDVWRASELAVARSTTQATGHAALDQELPHGGWPRSALVELLVQQNGIGELQLLKPALARLSRSQHIALIQPPFIPHAMAFRSWDIDPRHMLWLQPESSADAAWAAEQILKNGSCGAVVLWQTHIRPEALRRLNLAAQSTDTWLWLVRPLAVAADASPSPLRLALRPAVGGIAVDVIKRRGPHCETPLFIPLAGMPARQPDHNNEADTLRLPATAAARSAAPALV